jgi:FkbM family methyltransferase
VIDAARRRLRTMYSRVAGALLGAAPRLERPFIRAGRGPLARSRIGRGLYWYAEDGLVRRLRRSGDRFRVLPIGGRDLFVDVTDGSARLHYFHGEPYEPQLVEALAETLRPGDVFVDVGANIGFFSVLAARLVGGGGRVFAFEPDPGARAVLRLAAARNGVAAIVDVIEAAAGHEDGRTRLFLSSDSVLSTTDPRRSPLAADFTFDRAIDVAQMRLDTWSAAHRALLPRLRAVKIDVEGTEDEVVTGMRETIAACPGAIVFCETTPGSAADRWLTSHGYTATCLEIRQGTFGNYRYAR